MFGQIILAENLGWFCKRRYLVSCDIRYSRLCHNTLLRDNPSVPLCSFGEDKVVDDLKTTLLTFTSHWLKERNVYSLLAFRSKYDSTSHIPIFTLLLVKVSKSENEHVSSVSKQLKLFLFASKWLLLVKLYLPSHFHVYIECKYGTLSTKGPREQ